MTGSREGPIPCVPQHTEHVQSACLTERARGVRALNRRELPRRLRGRSISAAPLGGVVCARLSVHPRAPFMLCARVWQQAHARTVTEA